MSMPADPGTKIDISAKVEIVDPKVLQTPGRFLGAFDAFFRSPLGGAIVTLLFTTLVGGALANYYAEKQRVAAEYAQRSAASEATRRALIESFTKTFAARRVAVGLVNSTIVDNASKKELDARWDAYQQAYLTYNLNDFTFKSDLLEYLGAGTSSQFTRTIDRSISKSFRRIDQCLTKAYRLKTSGHSSGATTALKSCKSDDESGGPPRVMKTELETLQGCFATFETELMYTIYLENNFDRLTSKERNKQDVTLSNPKTHYTATFKLANMPSDIPEDLICSPADDWVCQRLRARRVIRRKLNVAPCIALEYQTPANIPVSVRR